MNEKINYVANALMYSIGDDLVDAVVDAKGKFGLDDEDMAKCLGMTFSEYKRFMSGDYARLNLSIISKIFVLSSCINYEHNFHKISEIEKSIVKKGIFNDYHSKTTTKFNNKSNIFERKYNFPIDRLKEYVQKGCNELRLKANDLNLEDYIENGISILMDIIAKSNNNNKDLDNQNDDSKNENPCSKMKSINNHDEYCDFDPKRDKIKPSCCEQSEEEDVPDNKEPVEEHCCDGCECHDYDNDNDETDNNDDTIIVVCKHTDDDNDVESTVVDSGEILDIIDDVFKEIFGNKE